MPTARLDLPAVCGLAFVLKMGETTQPQGAVFVHVEVVQPFLLARKEVPVPGQQQDDAWLWRG